jgi:hypothetical protein
MIFELWRVVVSSIGIILEIIGFILMQKSVKELILKKGSFTSNEYVDPKTGEPPPTAVGPPDPEIVPARHTIHYCWPNTSDCSSISIIKSIEKIVIILMRDLRAHSLVNQELN